MPENEIQRQRNEHLKDTSGAKKKDDAAKQPAAPSGEQTQQLPSDETKH